ncbi:MULTISPECIES: hypothetical protein [unclassified Streptomyces]|uniref:hypothetical protein n=1 Tax=unclassified Streptomyces TaxID=2593676 RepID=UPI001011DF63|nr:hypothetical protein [Streptomyces sp. GZWMJZ-114]
MQAYLRASLPGVDVRQYDDGSRPGMHDFNLYRNGHRFAALEVTTAMHAAAHEQWQRTPRGNTWTDSRLSGEWTVRLASNARVKSLKARLPTVLAALEAADVSDFNGSWGPGDEWLDQAESLGIDTAHRSPRTVTPGAIHCLPALDPEQAGGWVAETGDGFAHWVGQWLREPSRADNLSKLRRSGARERHLFVLIPMLTSAPFTAFDPLLRSPSPLPTVPPDLPTEVSHVWGICTHGDGDAFHWSPSRGWTGFPKPWRAEPQP